MPSLLSTLETICQVVRRYDNRYSLDENLDPRCQSLRHNNQNEIQAENNLLIKEVIGVPCKEEEFTEEDNGSKRKTIKGFDIFDAPQNTMSLSAATADDSEVKGAKELLWQMSATWEVENYLDFLWLRWHKMWFPWIGGKFIDIISMHSATSKKMALCDCYINSFQSECGLASTAEVSRLKGNVLWDQVMIGWNAHCLMITDDEIRDQFSKIK